MFSSDPARLLAFACYAEELGYDGVFAFDHLMPLDSSADGPAFEAFATLAAVGAATRRISVGTLVARASLRPVGLLAKLAASLDGISGGRLILTVGTGDARSRREHEAFGLPYLPLEERRAHLGETVSALRALLAGGPWPGGDAVGPIDGPVLPAPPGPGPTLWVGGLSDQVVRIAATGADGWNGWGLDPDGFARRAALLRDVADGAGRSVEPTWANVALVGSDRRDTDRLLAERRAKGTSMRDVWVGDVEALRGRLDALHAHGATWAILLLAGPRDRMQLVADQVLPHARSLA
jgi:alkanesulfonate monooxygenase SsuD/methylene tetrahydromethanopterin reductase-like flavin-dependent oxidoreductase (luciferase family)